MPTHDLIVIGGGPAGLMAALAAARTGARVILADEDFRLGGRLLSDKHEIDGKPAAEWVARVGLTLWLCPNGPVSLTDPDSLRDYVRTFVLPAIDPALSTKG